MKKFLVTIEGTDCSFKATQTKMLRGIFEHCDGMTLGPKVEYPTYGPASKYIKSYLNGEYPNSPPDVNCLYYAVDRIIDFHNRWKPNYDNGEIIIADRYIGSNMIHQARNIESEEELVDVCDSIIDYECNVGGLPEPNVTILLLMDPELAVPIRAKQKEEEGNKNGMEHDIHEEDIQHMRDAYNNAIRVAELYGWKMVKCFDELPDGTKEIRNKYAIHFDVLQHVMDSYNEE